MTNLEMKVDALMRLCTAETEAARAEAIDRCRKLAGDTTAVSKHTHDMNLEAKIRSVLLDLGVPDHIIGHRYLVTALTIAVKDQNAVHAITSYLYPAVAEQHNTPGSRAERAIRHAVELSMDRGDLDILRSYFGNSSSTNGGMGEEIIWQL